MMFSKASQYAIRALSYLALHHEKGLCSLESIAQEEKIPQPYLGKILQGLASKRLVRSSKGLNGGFGLAVTPEKITLYSIVDAIENLSLTESDCFLGRSSCNEESPCSLHFYWKKLRSNHLAFLNAVTLQHVCAGNGNGTLGFLTDLDSLTKEISEQPGNSELKSGNLKNLPELQEEK